MQITDPVADMHVKYPPSRSYGLNPLRCGGIRGMREGVFPSPCSRDEPHLFYILILPDLANYQLALRTPGISPL